MYLLFTYCGSVLHKNGVKRINLRLKSYYIDYENVYKNKRNSAISIKENTYRDASCKCLRNFFLNLY